MKIADFLNLEKEKVKNLFNTDKATTLRESVIYEINRIGYINKSDIQSILNKNKEFLNYNNISGEYDNLIDDKEVINILEMAEYRTELMITKQYLQYYIDTGNFNLIPMPYPETDQEKERNYKIRISLEGMLKNRAD